MKYSVSNPETEQRVASVEFLEGEVSSWTVALLDEKGQENQDSKNSFSGAQVTIARGAADVRLNDGTRQIFPISMSGSDGSVLLSTALGNIKLLPSRGVPLEGAGGAQGGTKQIKSSMPGKVLKILCKPGDTIEAGQPILIIEAMKMENEIRAKHGGVIGEIPVQVGQKIETGEVLVKFEA